MGECVNMERERGGYFVLPGTPPRPGSGEKDKFCRFLCKNLNIFLENSTGSRAKNVLNQEHMMGECVDFLLPFPSFFTPWAAKMWREEEEEECRRYFSSEIHKIRLNTYFCNKSLRNIPVNCHNSDPGTVSLTFVYGSSLFFGKRRVGRRELIFHRTVVAIKRQKRIELPRKSM